MEKGPEMQKNSPETGAQRLVRALDGGSAAQVCAELAGVLAGPEPEVLTLLLVEERLAPYGLPGRALRAAAQPEQALAPLGQVPAVPLLRWWALLRLTGAYLPRVQAAFGWDEVMVQRLGQLDGWFCGGMPDSCGALKHRLQQPLPVEAEDALAAFAALSPEYAGLPALYAALLASGEPFRPEDLRITDAELLAEGVPGRRLAEVRRCLLEAVLDAPELNVWPTLAEMARALRWLV